MGRRATWFSEAGLEIRSKCSSKPSLQKKPQAQQHPGKQGDQHCKAPFAAVKENEVQDTPNEKNGNSQPKPLLSKPNHFGCSQNQDEDWRILHQVSVNPDAFEERRIIAVASKDTTYFFAAQADPAGQRDERNS